jgi:oxygen-independent coproporphyrinogen-3 oxidase
MESYSIYLHIPFCRHRCAYCDFNTYAGLESLIPQYTQALCSEIASLKENSPARLAVHTVYFGGGTPSLLPAAELERILRALQDSFQLQADCEISLEANPGTLSLGYLLDLCSLGINRLSLGVQSANPAELQALERQHDFFDVIQAVRWAAQSGMDNLNLDLIFGLPGQTLQNWQRTLDLVANLGAEHLSLYALTLEHGTPMAAWAQHGLIAEPDPDLAAEMYEYAGQRLAAAGYRQYEISNWAREESSRLLACCHNLQYWRNLPYLGLGAGAHGYASGLRTVDVLAPASYIQRLQAGKEQGERPFPLTPATQSAQSVDRQTEIGETMMMGLRLVQEGVSARAFSQRFGQELAEVFGDQIERLTRLGLLEWAGEKSDCLRLTPQAYLVGNQVFVEFI